MVAPGSRAGLPKDLSVLSWALLVKVVLYGFPHPADVDASPCISLRLQAHPQEADPTGSSLSLDEDPSSLGKCAGRDGNGRLGEMEGGTEGPSASLQKEPRYS